MLKEGKLAKKNTVVNINEELAIHVPVGFTYSDEQSVIGSNRLFVFIKEETNSTYYDIVEDSAGDYSFEDPFSAPQCFILSNAQGRDEALDLSSDEMKEALKVVFQKLTIPFECELVVEQENLLVYTMEMFVGNRQHGVMIVTPKYIYLGQAWVSDDEDGVTPEFFDFLEYAGASQSTSASKKKQAVEEPVIPAPTYSASAPKAQMKTIMLPVFDQMTLYVDEHVQNTDGLGLSADDFGLLMMSKDLDMVSKAPCAVSIFCHNEHILAGSFISELWESDQSGKLFCQHTRTNYVRGLDDSVRTKYISLGDKFGATYTPLESCNEYGRNKFEYFVTVYHLSVSYQITFKFFAKEDWTAAEKFVEAFIRNMSAVEGCELSVALEKVGKMMYENYGSSDACLDGVGATRLYTEDVFFNEEDGLDLEIDDYDLGMSVNGLAIFAHPTIHAHMNSTAINLMSIIKYVEKNEKLRVPASATHKNLLKVLDGRPLSGASLFDLCGHHMIKIEEKKSDEYILILDINFIKAIPDCQGLMEEFIKTLRAYNGKHGKFTYRIVSAKLLDSPLKNISTPVVGARCTQETVTVDGDAQETTSGKTISNSTPSKKPAKSATPARKESPKEDFEFSGSTIKKYLGAGGDVVIPAGVTAIGDAFSECDALTSVVIPNGVTSIDNCAFWNCTELTSVTIPDSVTSIGDQAFEGCAALISVTIPGSVTRIDSCAFTDCFSLTSVIIENGVAEIGDEVFAGCENLTSVTIPDSVTEIGSGAFEGCENITIYCAAEEQPEGWDEDWLSFYDDEAEVIWGYQPE